MRYIPSLFAAAALAIPSPALAAEPLRLKPSTKWNLNYADDSCRLARGFGEGDQRITLYMDQFAPSEAFRLMFVGKPLDRVSFGRPVEGTVRFGPAEAASKVTGMMGDADKDPALLIDGSVQIAPLTDAEESALEAAVARGQDSVRPPLGAARDAAATWLQVKVGRGREFVLETGPMDKPLAALRKCSWDTVAGWGLDVEQQKTLSRHPAPKNLPWFRSSDYPRGMMRDGSQAAIHARIMVDSAGRPTSCHIQASTRPKELDKEVCDVFMKRARFEPALDAQGKPAPSFWQQTVHFRIGD